MKRKRTERGDVQELPRPCLRGPLRLEEAIDARRSVREFADEPLTDRELSQLLWSAQGLTDEREGLRAAPSAGALYPLELYVATDRALYHYEAGSHALTVARAGDLRPALCRAALDQPAVREAPAVFVMAAVYQRTAEKYGAELSPRYVDMELGHAAQNLLLQAVALELGGVVIGAFHEGRVRRALELPEREEPRYLIPVGSPR